MPNFGMTCSGVQEEPSNYQNARIIIFTTTLLQTEARFYDRDKSVQTLSSSLAIGKASRSSQLCQHIGSQNTRTLQSPSRKRNPADFGTEKAKRSTRSPGRDRVIVSPRSMDILFFYVPHKCWIPATKLSHPTERLRPNPTTSGQLNNIKVWIQPQYAPVHRLRTSSLQRCGISTS